MTWNVPLVVATFVFFAFLLWRLRPCHGRRRAGRGKGAALRAAKQRVEAAKSDEERALALCDAGDAAAGGLAGSDSAVGYYLRAMRTNPRSAELVARAAQGLARRPRALESLLWRRLGAEPWSGGGEAAARAALDELARLYAGPLQERAAGEGDGEREGGVAYRIAVTVAESVQVTPSWEAVAVPLPVRLWPSEVVKEKLV